jgi:hypothetical protein
VGLRLLKPCEAQVSDYEGGLVVEIRQEPGGDGLLALVGGAVGAERAERC